MLSGGHMALAPRVVELLRAEGSDIPVVVGGIIPPEDAAALYALGEHMFNLDSYQESHDLLARAASSSDDSPVLMSALVTALSTTNPDAGVMATSPATAR